MSRTFYKIVLDSIDNYSDSQAAPNDNFELTDTGVLRLTGRREPGGVVFSNHVGNVQALHLYRDGVTMAKEVVFIMHTENKGSLATVYCPEDATSQVYTVDINNDIPVDDPVRVLYVIHELLNQQVGQGYASGILSAVHSLLVNVMDTTSATISKIVDTVFENGAVITRGCTNGFQPSRGSYQSVLLLKYQERVMKMTIPLLSTSGMIEAIYSPYETAEGEEYPEDSWTIRTTFPMSRHIREDIYKGIIETVSNLRTDPEFVDMFCDDLRKDLKLIMFPEGEDITSPGDMFINKANEHDQYVSVESLFGAVKELEKLINTTVPDKRFSLLAGDSISNGCPQYRLGIYYNPTVSHYTNHKLMQFIQLPEGLLIEYVEMNYPAVHVVIMNNLTSGECRAVSTNRQTNQFDLFEVDGPLTLPRLMRLIADVIVIHEGSGFAELVAAMGDGWVK